MSGNNGQLTWTNDTRKLSDLVPWDHNPRQISEKQADGLRTSIRTFGLAQPMLISPSGDIYDGHQRDNVLQLMDEYGPDAPVDVRVSSRELTEDERKELVIRLHKNVGEFDFDMLANLYDNEELIDFGFSPFELGLVGDENDPYAEWEGMPEFEQEDALGAVQTLRVHFASHEAVSEFERLVGQPVNEGMSYIWYPKQERAKLRELRYTDES